MINILNKESCVGCFACHNICPKDAITLEEDNEGFKYPKVDKEKCINCGLCEKVCPLINKNKIKDRRDKPIVMAAWSKDNFTRIDSSSGGAFSEIANKIFDEKGYVCGAIYDENFMVKHVVTNDRDMLPKLRSSKYLQSNINDCFKEIEQILKNKQKVLFCGSSCQVAGLYNYLGKDFENLLTCDFICRGMNSPKVFKKYLLAIEEKYKSKIKSIKFRNKKYGWHNSSTRIDFENGKKYIGGNHLDSYMIGFLKYNAFIRPSCYECQFKGLPRKADITLADFWGIEKIDPKLDNNKGTSLILLNTQKGEEIFKSLNNIHYKEIKSEKIFEKNVCMNKSVEKTENRKQVFKNIDNLSYNELSNRFFPEPKRKEKIKIKIKTICKKILKV